MGTVIRKQVTRPLPAGAVIGTKNGKRSATWTTGRGKTRTADVIDGADGTPRIRAKSRTWFAKYRDAAGIIRTVSTGCRDERAARQILADLERTEDRVRAGVTTEAESDAASRKAEPFAKHCGDYLTTLEARGVTPAHRANVRRFLERIGRECGFRRLADLNREAVESWLVQKDRDGMGAKTRNEYCNALAGFGKWAVQSRRLTANPFASLPRVNAKADPRRPNRALTAAELARLLDVAARRPLDDARTVRRGNAKGEALAKLSPSTVARLTLEGRQRALIYKTLATTGLRLNELRTLTVGQLDLDTDPAFLTLDAADEKNRQGNSVPVRSDLAADLRAWLALRLDEERQKAARPAGRFR